MSSKNEKSNAKYAKWITPDGLNLLRGWARNGLKNDEIAVKVGVSKSTLAAWRARFPAINEAVTRGKEIVDNQVEEALIVRACGRYVEEYTADVDPETGEIISKRVTRKYIPGDATALIFWLKNRRPEIWRQNPIPVEAKIQADDGLMKALDRVAKEAFFDTGDDSDRIPEEGD